MQRNINDKKYILKKQNPKQNYLPEELCEYKLLSLGTKWGRQKGELLHWHGEIQSVSSPPPTHTHTLLLSYSFYSQKEINTNQ